MQKFVQRFASFAGPDFDAIVAADVARALAEDVGPGDLTAALVPPGTQARARVLAREAAVLCTMLNFLQLLSGVATRTAQFVAAVAGTRASIVDTRKTLPGLRVAQKYAVAVGGGTNHRMGLFDAILVKENHIAAAGGVAAVLTQAHSAAPQAKFVEIEVERLDQLKEALDCGATMVLLDNMDLPTLRRAVALNAGRAILEISGGVSLDTVRALAETGVDRISIGSLTKDVKATDYSMRFQGI